MRYLIAASSFVIAMTTAFAPSAPATTSPSLLLRWEGHTVKALPGPSRPCRQDPCGGARKRRMPVAAGAWLTIIYSHPGIEQMKVRLTRVTTATAVGVGPELTASPAPNGRWRVTLPRDLRRANSIDVTATDASGNRRRFHSYVSR